MITFNTSITNLEKTFKQVTRYFTDALQTISSSETVINDHVANSVIENCYLYSDSMAKSSPDLYKHMYEFGMSGSSVGRLFKLTRSKTANGIAITFVYVDAKIPAEDSDEIFRRKAQALEEGWTFTISPKNSDVLVFEIDGETIFTSQSVVTDPGKHIHGNFTNLMTDYFRYVAPRTIDRTLIEFAKFPNIQRGAATLQDGKTAAKRDVGRLDATDTSNK